MADGVEHAPDAGRSDAAPDADTSHQQDGNESSKPRNVSALKEQVKSKAKKTPPGGFDKTPFPDAPQGYTVRFVFHRAANLPPSDFDTASSDPFLVATLEAATPKRHKADPDLTHRTKTIRKTTEPEWQDEWVVANVPPTGFTLKCRMYDEDLPDANDRLGNVTIKIPNVYDEWEGIPSPGKEFDAKKRVIAKRAFLLKGISSMFKSHVHMTPRLCVSMEVLGKSDPPFAHMYTVGPAGFVKHFSPMIGRLAGTKVNADEEDDVRREKDESKKGKKSQRYDFQANEIQLKGPVPPNLYHRYVEFKPFVELMFASTGIRGKILNKALHKQHARVYNFDNSTEYGNFEACTKEASLQFLKLAHFDAGGRMFTYVLTLDGLLRFTETGKEFGIDLLSKHTMHSNVERYIACSGEFFIRRLQHPDSSDEVEPGEKTHPNEPLPGGPPNDDPPLNPSYYQLIIDNDSGTYRPDKSILPDLKAFLERNFPGLGVIAMHWEEEELKKLKEKQRSVKKNEGRMVNVVMNQSQDSIGSAESALAARDETWEKGHQSKREAAFAAVEDPSNARDAVKTMLPRHTNGESAAQS